MTTGQQMDIPSQFLCCSLRQYEQAFGDPSEMIEPDLPSCVVTTFEDIAQEVVWTAIRRGELDLYGESGR
jgi:hypothetical protein